MMTQFEDMDDFVRWNEEMSRKYDSEAYHLRSNFLIRWVEKRRVQAVLDCLNANVSDSVLEVGCGAGIVLEQIPAGYLFGIDLSGFILQKTRQRLSKRPSSLLQANAEKLPFASQSVRKLVCTEVIEHVLEPRNVITELARVATPDATIVITIPNETLIERLKALVVRLGLARWLLQGTKQIPEGTAAYDSPDKANEWHLHQFDMALLQEKTAGVLQMTRVQPVPFALLPLRYVVQCAIPETLDLGGRRREPG